MLASCLLERTSSTRLRCAIPTMPGAGKTAQAVVATRRLENSLHASIMTIVPCLCKTMAAASSAGGNAIRAIRQDPAKYGSLLVAKCRAIWYEIFRLVDDGPIGNKNIATELPTIRPEFRLRHLACMPPESDGRTSARTVSRQYPRHWIPICQAILSSQTLAL